MEDVCIDIEHSYLGDLNIVLICPNGQQVTLHQYPGGGGTYLGNPWDGAQQGNGACDGLVYCFDNTATGLLVAGPTQPATNTAGNTIVPGTYQPAQSFNNLVGCPLNGDWTIQITDNLGSDDGYIFEWGINFDPSIVPFNLSFTPTVVSEGWQADPTIVSTSGNSITVQPTSAGVSCYTYEMTDNFGCTYDTTICFNVLPSPVLDPITDVTTCNPYTLPAINGTNLTGNQAYFTGPNGTGTQYNPGDVINSTITLYAYDEMGVAPFYSDEEPFTITISISVVTLNCPGNLTAVCDISEQPVYASLAAFTAAGGIAISVGATIVPASFTLVSQTSNGNTCPEIVTRIYRIEDDCGNFDECTQTITIDDNIAPTGTAPANVTVQCIADVPAVNIGSVTGVSDNCGVPTVTHLGDASNGNTCPQIITRTYRITDACGNFTDVVQTITIDDDTAPTLSNPRAVNVACITDVPAANPAVVSDSADNCGAPIVAHVGDVSDGNVCNGEVITRTYSVTDACGNSITVTQTITIDAITPTFTLSSTDPTACGVADGTITISGLTPGEDYEISFNGGGVVTMTADGSGNIVLTGLSAGSYTGFEVSLNGCLTIDNTSINLVDPNPPTVGAGVDQTICDGDQATLTANNPDGATITWNNGVTDGVAFTPGVGTITYTVTANLAGCISTDQVDVTVNPLPVVDAGADQTVCDGDQVTLTAVNPNGATITWDNGVTDGTAFTPGLGTTTYTVTANLLRCISTDQVAVTVNPVALVSFFADELVGCIPTEVNFTNTTVGNPENCVWNIGGVQFLGCDNINFMFNQAGCFDVSLTVTSTEGCVSSATYANYICIDDYPTASFTASPLIVTTIDTEVDFINSSIGGSTYSWDFGDDLGFSTEENPSYTYLDTEDGNYEVQLIVYSQYGCSDTTTAIVQVREELIFWVPNTFTPDGNKFNEAFLPLFTSGFDPYDFNLLIFNRWGEVLFESNNHQVGWDGTYGGNIVKDGTYIWKIEFKTKYTDERQVHHGHVNVLR